MEWADESINSLYIKSKNKLSINSELQKQIAQISDTLSKIHSSKTRSYKISFPSSDTAKLVSDLYSSLIIPQRAHAELKLPKSHTDAIFRITKNNDELVSRNKHLFDLIESLRKPTAELNARILASQIKTPQIYSDIIDALNEPTLRLLQQWNEQHSTRKNHHHHTEEKHTQQQEDVWGGRKGATEVNDTADHISQRQAGTLDQQDCLDIETTAVNKFIATGDIQQGIEAIATFATHGENNPSIWMNPWVVALVLALIQAIMNPYIDYYEKKYLEEINKDSNKKEVREKAETISQYDLFNTHRILNHTVKVRVSPAANAKAPITLPRWQLVQVLEVRKDWTLISWRDSTGAATATGWVFSRYLSKPNTL